MLLFFVKLLFDLTVYGVLFLLISCCTWYRGYIFTLNMTDTKKSDAKKSPTSKKSRPRVHGRMASRNRPDLRRDSMETTKYGNFFSFPGDMGCLISQSLSQSLLG